MGMEGLSTNSESNLCEVLPVLKLKVAVLMAFHGCLWMQGLFNS